MRLVVVSGGSQESLKEFGARLFLYARFGSPCVCCQAPESATCEYQLLRGKFLLNLFYLFGLPVLSMRNQADRRLTASQAAVSAICWEVVAIIYAPRERERAIAGFLSLATRIIGAISASNGPLTYLSDKRSSATCWGSE